MLNAFRAAGLIASMAITCTAFSPAAFAEDCDCVCLEGYGVKVTWVTYTYRSESVATGCVEERSAKVPVCGAICAGATITYDISTTSCVALSAKTGQLTFEINSDGSVWTLNDVDYPGEPGDTTASCTELEYKLEDETTLIDFKITLKRGPCESLDGATSPCSPPQGDSDCESDENLSNQSDESVAYLTGHKLERAVDLTVPLPGRDFELVREYSSDTSLYGSGPNYYWNGRSDEVVPGLVGVNWTLGNFQRLFGDHDAGSPVLQLTGSPIRTTRSFVRVESIVPVRFVAGGSANEHIIPQEVDHPQLGSDIPVYRLKTPGGIEYDFVRRPATLPAGNNGLGREDLMGRLVFERDAHGNTWYYEYDILIDSTTSSFDPVILKSIYLNWKPGVGSGDSTWDARVDFLWNGQPGTPYSTVPQWVDANSNAVWDSGESTHHFGRLAEVRVVRKPSTTEIVVQKVRYLYFDDLAGLTESSCTFSATYDGSPGDLCEVIASDAVDHDAEVGDGFYERVWQYRYYDGTSRTWYDLDLAGTQQDIFFYGDRHQLLAVFYPEQIEFFADHYGQLADEIGLFGSGFTGYTSPAEAAERLRWVRFNSVPGQSNSTCFGAAWEDYFLPNEQWQTLFDVASKVIAYDPTQPNSTGRVVTQIVNAGDGSGCGCSGGTAIGGARLGKRYDYIYNRYNWTVLPQGVPDPSSFGVGAVTDGFTCTVVESRIHVETGPPSVGYVPYRTESHDYVWPSTLGPGDLTQGGYSGIAWKAARTQAEANTSWNFSRDTNPIATADAGTGSGRRWVNLVRFSEDGVQPGSATSFNSFRKPIELVTPSANDWADYLPAVGSASPTLPALLEESGLVIQHAYSGGWKSETTLYEGDSVTGVTPVTMTYSTVRPDLVTQITRSPGEGPTTDTPVESTSISYGFHSGSGLDVIVAWEKRVVAGETMVQNGPNTAVDSVTFRLYDRLGQLRWEQDAHGTLTYREYDSKTGALKLIVRDANPSGAYVGAGASLTTDFTSSGLASSGFTAPSGSFQELKDTFTHDLLGRVTAHTDPSGHTRYTRYEVRPTNLVDEDGALVSRGVPYFAAIALPHKFGSEFDGPARIDWQTAGGKLIRSSNFIPNSSGTYPPTTGAFTPLSEVTRSDEERVISGAVVRSREWHSISTPTAASGTRPFTNAQSYVTSYEYDAVGRPTLVIDPESGGSEFQYDVLDRVTQVASGVGTWDGSGVLSVSSLPVSFRVYDSETLQPSVQGVGNGNLTYTESYDGVATRTSKHWYDFRDRRIGTQSPAAPHASVRYDNLNRVIEEATFTDATGFGSGTPDPGEAGTNRSTYIQTLYNNRGMVYRTRVAIDPTDDGLEPEFLESNRWFDADGLLVASWDPNGPGTKTVYDRLHRPSVVYTTDRSGDEKPGTLDNYTDATAVAGDRIIEQTEYAYVPVLNPLVPGTGQAELITHRMRLHDTDETGALDDDNAVATYTLYQFDDASRAFKTHAYGTNNADFKKGTLAPNRLSAGDPFTTGALTSEVDFDLWGRQILSISPEGKKTFSVLDALSRQIAAVEGQALITADHIDLASGGGTWEVDWTDAYSGSSGIGPDDADRVTTFFYDGLSNVTNRTAHLPDGSVQETIYDYGTTTVTTSTPETDSLVSSSRLLREVRYPNESTGLAGTTAAYKVTYGYNRLGELRGMSDQNGTIHVYTRDALGRVTLDDVPTFGTNIDQAVHSIATSYDADGRVASVISRNGSDAPVNGVEFGYTPLHQIATLTQHVAYTSTTPTVTGVMSYAYEYQPVGSGSTGNFWRLASITYPNEQGASPAAPTVLYVYGKDDEGAPDPDLLPSRIGRVSGIDVPSWNSGSDHLVDYTYLGASTAVRVHYPSTTHGLGLDAIKAKSGEDGAPDGHYPGFDKFGRVVHHAWVTDGFTEGSGGNPDRTPLLARAYDYDMDSNRKLDYDARPGAVRNDRDWKYLYDDLNRLRQANRGREAGGFTVASNSQKWHLDVLGNWKTIWTDTDGDAFDDANEDGVPDDVFPERENRTHNRANEITLQERPNGMSSQLITQPVYDDAGNYAHNISSTTARLTYKHDAWNRLVKVFKGTHANPGVTVLENEFNGLNHRIRRRMDLSQGAYNGLDEARIYFYSANWQVLEEWIDADLAADGPDDGSATGDDTDRRGQQFWGVRYIDDAVARRVDRNGDGEFSGTNADNFFYLTDVMFSVRAIVDGAGRLHTRLDYTPYGVAMHGFAADVNGDGSVNVSDLGVVSTNSNGGSELAPGASGYDPDAFLDGGTEIDVGVYLTRYTPYVSGGSNPTFNAGWIDNPGDLNGPDNSVGYDGYWFDLAGATEATSSGLYMVRHRVYDPRLGRWLQRDPMGYVDGQNLFEYSRSSSVTLSDPAGLDASSIPPVVENPRFYTNDDGVTYTTSDVDCAADCSPWKGKHRFEPGRASGGPDGCRCEVVWLRDYSRSCPIQVPFLCNQTNITYCPTEKTVEIAREQVVTIKGAANCQQACNVYLSKYNLQSYFPDSHYFTANDLDTKFAPPADWHWKYTMEPMRPTGDTIPFVWPGPKYADPLIWIYEFITNYGIRG